MPQPHFLTATLHQFRYYKSLGDAALAQTSDEDLHWRPDAEANSIAIIIQHMAGNMRSRWTDPFTTDGEKPDRNREEEFSPVPHSRSGLTEIWEAGWKVLFTFLEGLNEDDFLRTLYIRKEPYTLVEAIQRQLAHYPYHVGQIVYIARMRKGPGWKSLSIPRGNSEVFNRAKGM